MKQNMDLPSCKWNLLKVFILICTTLASTVSFGQAGNAPMQQLPPFPGPFAIDGFLQRQGASGDWLAAAGGSANNFVFTNAGVPVPGIVLAYLKTDLWDDLVNDDIFDGGNKLNQNPNVWGWRSQKPPAKDDINNAMVFLALNPANNHIWLAISGDRLSTNGTSYIDFEFYQNSISKTGGPIPGGTGGFTSSGPHNGRTIGDISITLEITGGGSNATVKYLQWQAGSEAGEYDYVDLTPAVGTAFAAANDETVNVPYGAFGETTYEPLQFAEGAIDLTALIGGGGLPGECGSLPFESLFIKTKSSAEKTADLKDFISPFSIDVCFDRTAPVINCPSTINLGCNPTIPGPSGATASDNCNGAIIPVAADGPVSSNGCSRSMTRVWRATDGCGNSATCGQQINWTEDNTGPVITTGGTGPALGCNPTAGEINGALGTASASDLCGAPTLSVSDGSVSSDGCGRSQTRTWTARDACGNSSTASRTATWTSDITAPTFSGSYTAVVLGCNPTSGDINSALGSASATDGCSNTTITSSDGSVSPPSCTRSQTRTFTARDACGNTATISRTVSWTSDLTPPTFTGSYTPVQLSCNPAASDITAALNGATATDACGLTTITQSDGAVQSSVCGRSQARTFTARDACGNTATISRTVTWTTSPSPPTFTGSYATVPLGCNPVASDITNALDGATATSACGSITPSSSDGPVVSTGCARSQTRTFTASDGCGSSATISRTVTWTADVTAPGFIGNYSDVTLTCNVSEWVGSLGTANATDACGTPTITQNDGPVVSNGCNRSITRTFTARDGCNNTATVSRTVRWIAVLTDITLNVNGQLAIGTQEFDLGCNPLDATINTTLGTANATNGCATPSVTAQDGPLQTNGCERVRVRTFTATDDCGHIRTAARLVRWIINQAGTQITPFSAPADLGCNPTADQINAALGSVTATDACVTVTITSMDGPTQSDGCNRSRTRTFTATGGCGNTASASRTVTWKADLAAPVFTGGYADVTLSCNPPTPDASLGSASATDGCGAVTITQSDGSVQSSGCNRSRTRTFTARDACNNTATISRTVRWIFDNTAPVFTITPASVDIACTDPIPTAATPTATDACGTPTVTQTGNTDNSADCSTGFGRVVTRTWRAQDACGNTATYTQTIRVACCPTAYCTYTQGAYGTTGGKMCDGENGGFSTAGFIAAVLDNLGGLTVGKPGHSIVMANNPADVDCIIDHLPGNSGAKELPDGDVGICSLPNGPLKNVLAGQTITLGLNLGITNTQLGSFVLQAGVLATQDPVNGCGDETPKPRVCRYNTLAPYNLIGVDNEYTYRTFTQAVIDAIPGANTVANLFELANRALANVDGVVGSEGGVSLSAINDAVSSVNEVFDNCKIFIGWNVAACAPIDPTPGDGKIAATTVAPALEVTAYPNPYQENFSLKVNSPVTGQASVSFYTIDGVKISEMKRDVVAKRDVWIPFNVPAVYRTRIVYTVNVGSHNAKGVVLSPN